MTNIYLFRDYLKLHAVVNGVPVKLQDSTYFTPSFNVARNMQSILVAAGIPKGEIHFWYSDQVKLSDPTGKLSFNEALAEQLKADPTLSQFEFHEVALTQDRLIPLNNSKVALY